MRKPEAKGPEVNLRDIPEDQVAAYFENNPFPKGCCLTYPLNLQHMPRRGVVLRLLAQIPATEKEKVTGLDLDYAELADEDLPQIAAFFPTLQELSVGFELSPEPLGCLVEALPNLQSLGLRRLNLADSADAHIERLTRAAQHGGLQNLSTLLLLQTKVSAQVMENFFRALPKLRELTVKGTMLDGHVPMLLRAFEKRGALGKLKYFGLGRGTGLSAENLKVLLTAFTGDAANLDEFLDDEERIETLGQVIQEGHLNQLVFLSLSHNQDIPPGLLAGMLGGLQNLQEIELNDMQLTDEHMRALAEERKAGRLEGIRSFQIKENPELSLHAVAEVAKGMKNLSSLGMIGMDLSGPSAQEFAVGWQELTSLNLTQSRLSEQALRYFVSQKPALKSLNLNDTDLTDGQLAVLA